MGGYDDKDGNVVMVKGSAECEGEVLVVYYIGTDYVNLKGMEPFAFNKRYQPIKPLR